MENETMSKKLKLADPANKLEKRVQAIINRMSVGYDDGAIGVMDDVQRGGCESGIIPDLIYYTDTVRFYRAYRNEINALLAEDCRDMGQSPQELLSKSWDDDDPLALEEMNQNLLAWYGFERVVEKFYDALGRYDE